MKKTIKRMIWIFFILSFLSCENSDNEFVDVNGLPPIVELATPQLRIEPGSDFVVKAAISDLDGLSHITLECGALNLRKTINLLNLYDEILTTYDLNYTLSTQKDDTELSQYIILLNVTDVGGRTTRQEMLVSMDGDSEAPLFTKVIKSEEIINSTDKLFSYNLEFAVADNKKLGTINIVIKDKNEKEIARESITEFGDPRSYSYAKTHILVSKDSPFSLNIEVSDEQDNIVSTEGKVVISEDDYSKIYLSDVTTVEELTSDICGVPMLIERTAPYTYKAVYYNSKANTNIYFIPQNNSFEVCYGLDPNDIAKIKKGYSIDEVTPIILSEANKYYSILISTLNNTIDISSYSPEEAQNRLPLSIGDNFYLWDSFTPSGKPNSFIPFQLALLMSDPSKMYGDGAPEDGLMLNQDVHNPHIFTKEYDLTFANTHDGALNFAIHNYRGPGNKDWWNHCAYYIPAADGSDEQKDVEISLSYFSIYEFYSVNTSNVPQKKFKDIGKPNPYMKGEWMKPILPKVGKYLFTFDSHLEKVKFTLIDK